MTMPEPSLVHRYSDRWDAVTDEWPSAQIQRRLRHGRKIRFYHCEWDILTESELQQVRAEFNSAKGPAQVFSFIPVDASAGSVVRFVEGTLSWRSVSANHFQVSAEVAEEVI